MCREVYAFPVVAADFVAAQAGRLQWFVAQKSIFFAETKSIFLGGGEKPRLGRVEGGGQELGGNPVIHGVEITIEKKKPHTNVTFVPSLLLHEWSWKVSVG